MIDRLKELANKPVVQWVGSVVFLACLVAYVLGGWSAVIALLVLALILVLIRPLRQRLTRWILLR